MLLKSILEYSWKGQTLINNLISMSNYILTFKNWNFMKISKKRGLWKIFGPILGFYTKNSPRNSWSSHFMITFWNQKSRNVRTPCTRHFHFELNHRSVTKLKLFLFYVSVITCYLWVVFLLKIQWEISLQGLQGLQ